MLVMSINVLMFVRRWPKREKSLASVEDNLSLNICSRRVGRRLKCTTRLRVFTVMCFSLIPESLL